MRVLQIAAVAAAALALAACGQHSNQQSQSAAQPASPEQVPTGRLPADVQPLAYTLDFTMDPDKPGYSAHEEIAVKLTKPRDTIWLHGRGIDVTSATLALAGGKTLAIDYKQVNDDGVAKLSLGQTVQPQQARIVLDFTNQYAPGLLGAYKVNEDGNNYIFTQFEAIAARRAFVSFDEPGFKTPFSYSFTVPKGDKVVANTPVEHRSDAGNGMVKWQFMTTKPLPTYLAAWAIGPLDIVKGPDIPPDSVRQRPIPLYGVAVKGKGAMMHYALAHAGEIVQFEEKYYGIAYPWRKLSLIAVPDFGAGAMENAGAITFRDSILLMNPKTAPTEQKRHYWVDTAHELGHMWTGDLVTVPWWNDIWLNEAFATWMEQKVMDELHPEWHSQMAALDSRQYAMRADSLVSARAVRQPIRNTGDIRNAFDGITYEKGAAVISMFENYVGPDKFRAGMHNYLRENAYGSASLNDFLNAISKAAGIPIGPAFKTFLNQPGLPLVEATLKDAGGKVSVHLTQSRYLPLGSTGNAHGTQWQIPVCMRYPAAGKTVDQCVMLSDTSADAPLKSHTLPAWFMPNANGVGYYQWSLGTNGYARLAKSMDKLTPVGRMSLAGSVEAAFNAGKIDTADAMRTLAPLADAAKYPRLAEEPMGLISFARERLVTGKEKQQVEAYARKLYAHYDVAGDFRQGGAPKDANRTELEADVAAFLADTGRDPHVRQAAAANGMRVLGLTGGHGKPDLTAISPDFLPVALRVAVQDDGARVYDALEKIFRSPPNPFVRNAALNAMASATDPQLARRARAMALEPGMLKRNQIFVVVFGQLEQPETRAAAWDWFKANYGRLVKVLPDDYVARLPAVARFFCSDARADEVQAFFKGKLANAPGSDRVLRESLESARLCAARRKAQSASAGKFFSSF